MSPQQIITITISFRSQRIVAEKVAVEKAKSNNQIWSWRSWLSQLFCHIFWSLPPFLQRGQSQTRKRTKWVSKWYPGNCWSMIALPAKILQNRLFSLKFSVQLFVSVVFRALWKGKYAFTNNSDQIHADYGINRRAENQSRSRILS